VVTVGERQVRFIRQKQRQRSRDVLSMLQATRRRIRTVASPTPTNKALYSRVKSEAKRKFDVWPSAYASAWLTKEYKKRGGKYKGTTANKVKKRG